MTLHPIRFSTGIVFTDQDPGHEEFSFAVTRNGSRITYGGWGRTGPTPDTGHYGNAPMGAVHTVLITGVDDDKGTFGAMLASLRYLVEEHLRRYGECRAWVESGTDNRVAKWVSAGCPSLGEDVGEDDEEEDPEEPEEPEVDEEPANPWTVDMDPEDPPRSATDAATVRAWALEHRGELAEAGVRVSPQGRVSQKVWDAYEKAHEAHS